MTGQAARVEELSAITSSAIATASGSPGEDAGIEVAGSGAHHEAASGREAHRRIDADAATDRRHARAIAELGDDDAALGLAGG